MNHRNRKKTINNAMSLRIERIHRRINSTLGNNVISLSYSTVCISISKENIFCLFLFFVLFCVNRRNLCNEQPVALNRNAHVHTPCRFLIFIFIFIESWPLHCIQTFRFSFHDVWLFSCVIFPSFAFRIVQNSTFFPPTMFQWKYLLLLVRR